MSKVSTFVIPDIHGNLLFLDELLDRLRLSEGDRIITLGDYVDRGPSSRGVIDRLLSLKPQYEMIYLMGNHEQIFIEYLNQKQLLRAVHPDYQRARKREGLKNGGRVFRLPRTGGIHTLLSYGYSADSLPRDINLPEEHIRFFSEMQLFWQEGDYLCVHGGVSLTPEALAVTTSSELLQHTSVREMLWSRDLVDDPHIDAQWWFRVVCGHTAQLSGLPLVSERVICLDVGAGYDKELCALELGSQLVYFANRPEVMHLSELFS